MNILTYGHDYPLHLLGQGADVWLSAYIGLETLSGHGGSRFVSLRRTKL